jgi:Caspase domain
MRKALSIGINDYPHAPLFGCANDARSISKVLETHENGAPNFSVKLFVDENVPKNTREIRALIDELFSGVADVALFYFAGHGEQNERIGESLLCLPDDNSISLSEILAYANSGQAAGIREKVIVLDCCNSGGAGGGLLALGQANVAVISTGTVIYSACSPTQTAGEKGGAGIFTSLFVRGLEGGAADICGNVTPGGLYAYVDQALGPWEQRPLFKAHVSQFTFLRRCNGKVTLETLRMLPIWFAQEDAVYSLDPQHEHTNPAATVEKKALFRELQNCNRVGLVEPLEGSDMYWAAINSKGCRLTPLGKHYRTLAASSRI